jgi:hypothetical protein
LQLTCGIAKMAKDGNKGRAEMVTKGLM